MDLPREIATAALGLPVTDGAMVAHSPDWAFGSISRGEPGNLNYRTNNALTQTFAVDSLNQLTNATRSGTLTVAGFTVGSATNVTVNGSAATRYADKTFVREGLSLSSGNNTFTAIAQDANGRLDTNAVTVNLPATVTFSYDLNGNLLSDGQRAFDYDDGNYQ